MATRRCCVICRRKFSTLKILKNHYSTRHCKLEIIKRLIKCSISLLQSNYSLCRKKNSNRRKIKVKMETRKTETLCLVDNVQITYGNEEIMIEKGSDDEESLEISIEELPTSDNGNSLKLRTSTNIIRITGQVDPISIENNMESLPNSRDSSIIFVETNNNDKRQDYNTVKATGDSWNSLNEQTGRFYVCHCKNRATAELTQNNDVIVLNSDTESSSDTGKNVFYPMIDKDLYCEICGNGYKTKSKLMEHKKSHRLCCTKCNISFRSAKDFREHVRKHFQPVFMCHICNYEFVNRSVLRGHLDCHAQDDMYRNVLELEQNYSHYLVNFNSSNYETTLNNISSYLEHGSYECSRNNMYSVIKLTCQYCLQQYSQNEFEQHVQMHYRYANFNL